MTLHRWNYYKKDDGFIYHGKPDQIRELLLEAIKRIESIPPDHKETSTVYFARDAHGGYIKIESVKEF